MKAKHNHIWLLLISSMPLFVLNAKESTNSTVTMDPHATLQPSQWENDPPFIAVGLKGGSPWASVEAPASVIHAAAIELRSVPDTWQVANLIEFGPSKKHIVSFSDTSGQISFTCLVETNLWVHLNESSAVPTISRILNHSLHSLADLKDPGKVIVYIENIAYLREGPRRLVLSADKFSMMSDSSLSHWVSGTQKDVKQFRKLCKNPSVIVKGTHFEINCNIINVAGAVEKWTVVGKITDSVIIKSISIQNIYANKTFSWGLVGG